MGTVWQEYNPGEEHNYLELKSRWLCVINTRLKSEKQLHQRVNKRRVYQPCGKHLGTSLDQESNLPND